MIEKPARIHLDEEVSEASHVVSKSKPGAKAKDVKKVNSEHYFLLFSLSRAFLERVEKQHKRTLGCDESGEVKAAACGECLTSGASRRVQRKQTSALTAYVILTSVM